jgi:hypothetical protein
MNQPPPQQPWGPPPVQPKRPTPWWGVLLIILGLMAGTLVVGAVLIVGFFMVVCSK